MGIVFNCKTARLNFHGLGVWRPIVHVLPPRELPSVINRTKTVGHRPDGTYLVTSYICPEKTRRIRAAYRGLIRWFAVRFPGHERASVELVGGLLRRLRARLEAARLEAEASVKAALAQLRAEFAALAESGPGSDERELRRERIALLRWVIAALSGLIAPARPLAHRPPDLAYTLAAGGQTGHYSPLA